LSKCTLNPSLPHACTRGSDQDRQFHAFKEPMRM
jgi:hypothetical protein